jgi:paraquat-inducible protein A
MPGAESPSLFGRFRLQGGAINLLLVATLCLFLYGVFAPLLTLKKFFIFSNTVSLASSLGQLADEGYYLILVLVFCFSILLPVAKLFVLLRLVNARLLDTDRHRRHLHWMARIGKWSMLDVFVVAVLLVTVKLNVIADVAVHAGLYAFAASVFLTMGLTAWVGVLAEHAADTASGGRDQTGS